jgi:hypothetical protein
MSCRISSRLYHNRFSPVRSNQEVMITPQSSNKGHIRRGERFLELQAFDSLLLQCRDSKLQNGRFLVVVASSLRRQGTRLIPRDKATHKRCQHTAPRRLRDSKVIDCRFCCINFDPTRSSTAMNTRRWVLSRTYTKPFPVHNVTADQH